MSTTKLLPGVIATARFETKKQSSAGIWDVISGLGGKKVLSVIMT